MRATSDRHATPADVCAGLGARDITVGAILAGGEARRMGGGDKGLLQVGGRPLLQLVIRVVQKQVAALVLNGNDDPARFAAFGLLVVPDNLAGRRGPLVGILAAMDWAAEHAAQAEWLVTTAADMPFLPHDLVAGLHAARQRRASTIACAASGGRTHWVIGLWPVRLRGELRDALTQDDVRSVRSFVGRYDTSIAEWPDDPVDPFFNVNTPEDLAAAARLAAQFPDL